MIESTDAFNLFCDTVALIYHESRNVRHLSRAGLVDPEPWRFVGSADCSKTTCGLGFPDVVRQLEQQGVFQVGTRGMDIIGLMEQDFRVKSVSEGELKVGDFIHYANSQGPQHFATFIFRDENGVPKVFSKSGTDGPYQIVPYNRFSSNYGTIQGRPGTR